MKISSDLAGTATADDSIRPLTKVVAAAVIPFLVVAFVILYLLSDLTGEWFAWEINPAMTAAVMGAGYLGGAYLFARVLTGVRWHHVAGGFLPVTVFTAIMLLATLLHWDIFDPGHWPFWVWLALYIITPVLVPVAWWLNRLADPGLPDAGDFILPAGAGWFMRVFGVLLLLGVVAVLVRPQLAIDIWPWTLTPLTARVMAGWQSLLAVGALMMAGERRWSGWRIPLQSILIWQALVTLAFFLYREDMAEAGLLNWYTVYTVGGLIASIIFYVWAERQRQK